jgi:hypothetical protein
MDINLLVQRLRHGDSYTVQDGDNYPYQVNRPPNHLMIKAAEVILHQDGLLKQNHEALFRLQNKLNELTQQYEPFRNSSTAATSS